MIDHAILTKFYRERLAENIIGCIAETKHIPEREAMKVYYSSRLAKMIEIGKYGIDNLDFRNLTEDLIKNEPELFEEKAEATEKTQSSQE